MDPLPSRPTRLPAAIGRFQVVRRLGAGGMGEVYEGFDATVSRYVAVKRLRRDLLDEPEVAELFVLEAQRIAKLEAHPNIPTVYEVGVHEGLPFLAMQKVDGDSLADVLQKRGIAPVDLLRAVASAVGSALGFAHARGIVHCDVKPQNVLIDRSGKPYLTDFGLSRARQDPLGGGQAQALGLTPFYASPEQNQGKPADVRSDVYSLAVVLYEMCTGAAPFAHCRQDQLASVQLRISPARADLRNPKVPAKLADALDQGLQSDPHRRPTAVELARAVLLATDDQARLSRCAAPRQAWEDLQATPAVAPPKSPIRRRIALAALGLLGMTAALGLHARGLPFLAPGRSQSESPTQSPRFGPTDSIAAAQIPTPAATAPATGQAPTGAAPSPHVLPLGQVAQEDSSASSARARASAGPDAGTGEDALAAPRPEAEDAAASGASTLVLPPLPEGAQPAGEAPSAAAGQPGIAAVPPAAAPAIEPQRPPSAHGLPSAAPLQPAALPPTDFLETPDAANAIQRARDRAKAARDEAERRRDGLAPSRDLVTPGIGPLPRLPIPNAKPRWPPTKAPR